MSQSSIKTDKNIRYSYQLNFLCPTEQHLWKGFWGSPSAAFTLCTIKIQKLIHPYAEITPNSMSNTTCWWRLES